MLHDSERQLENERGKRLMAMGQMAASLAHEIRNPLGSMELFCSLLKRDLANQPGSLNLADQIHQAIKRLDRIVTNCLQFARDVVPRRKPVDTEKILSEILGEVKGKIGGDRAIDIELKLKGTGMVSIDRFLIQQALTNLLWNALDAVSARVPNEASAAHVLVESDVTDQKEWQISISDNGPGIDPAIREKVFDPFYTTKEGGTGLGLPIVHSVIAAHKGTISLESELGCGTRVTVIIPSKDEES